MEQESAFSILEFTNPSGEIVFRVTGWLEGKRVRKNFRTHAEAVAERQILEINALRGKTSIRVVPTRLTDQQLQEAEAVFRRVDGLTHSLSLCVEFTLTNYRAPEKQKSLANAISDYIAAKQHEYAQGHVSGPQMKRIESELKRFRVHFNGHAVSEVSSVAITPFLEIGHPALKTFNNRRGVLSTFFKFSFLRGWVAENPILKVPHYRIRRKPGAAKTLAVDQARKLMDHLETFEGGRWVPYFAMC